MTKKYSNRLHRATNTVGIDLYLFEDGSFKEKVDFKRCRGHTTSYRAQQLIATAKHLGLKIASSSYREVWTGQRVALLSLNPGMGPGHSRLGHHLTREQPSSVSCSVCNGPACTDSFCILQAAFPSMCWMFSSLGGKVLKWPKSCLSM